MKKLADVAAGSGRIEQASLAEIIAFSQQVIISCSWLRYVTQPNIHHTRLMKIEVEGVTDEKSLVFV